MGYMVSMEGGMHTALVKPSVQAAAMVLKQSSPRQQAAPHSPGKMSTQLAKQGAMTSLS